HLEANDPGTDHAQPLRHGGERERTVVVENQAVVERQRIAADHQGAWLRAGRDDDLLGGERGGIRSGDLDLPCPRSAAGKAADPGEERDLVLLEQVDDAVVVLADHFFLAREHAREVDGEPLDLDAVLGEAVAGMLVILRRLQQGFRRDAADVGAGSAGRRLAVGGGPVVDAGGPEAELGGAYGGDVAARSGADDDDIERIGHGARWALRDHRSSSMRAGSSRASLMATRDNTASRPSMMRWS